MHAVDAIQNVPQWRTAVRELVRVVRPGGVLLGAWGSNRPDPLVRVVREHYTTEVAPGPAASRSGRGYAVSTRLTRPCTRLAARW